jgi:hypothetical protein
MDHKLKRRWVAGLRGGYWRQIHDGVTEGERGVCALGVLVKILDRWPTKRELGSRCQKQIINLNDVERRPFAVIADWIEENVP